ncbi:T9SS type A sorting domain-containing protein [Spirosoma aerophilum]
MNTIIFSLFLSFTANVTEFAPPIIQSSPKQRATKLAHYQMSAYIAAKGTKLRVYVDKELGGQVSIQLMDISGRIYVTQVMNPKDTSARISMDISELTDGDYLLKVSNGLEMETRSIQISTQQPTTLTRVITTL